MARKSKATSEVKDQANADSPADVLPTPVDDVEPALAADTGTDGEATEATPEPEVVLPEYETEGDDKRAAIAKRYRDNRDAEMRGEGSDAVVEDDATDATEPLAADSEGEETVSEEGDDTKPASTNAPEDDVITLLVDGQLVKKTQAEVTALAQIAVASDNRLEEAKRILQDAQAVRDQAGGENPPHEPGNQNPQEPSQSQAELTPEHPPEIKFDTEKLRRIVERIQVGDADEGAEAFSEALRDAVSQGLANLPKPVVQAASVNPEQVGSIVEERLALNAQKTEIDSALNDFSEKYPTIVSDPIYAEAAASMIRGKITDALKAVGFQDHDLAPYAKDVQTLSLLHGRARAAGASIPNFGAIVSDVGTDMIVKFNMSPEKTGGGTSQPTTTRTPQDIAAAAQTANGRVERKRAAQTQPRTAGGRISVPQAPAPRTKQQIVAEMRKSRGFASMV